MFLIQHLDDYDYDVLDFTTDGFADGYQVIIKATGYADLKYTVDLNDEPVVEKLTPPEVSGFEKLTDSYNRSLEYYHMSFGTPASGTLKDYLSKVTEVTVETNNYKKEQLLQFLFQRSVYMEIDR
ncbi:MAG: hypothetical protein V8S98_13155 [Lachnospiraceae bacterium]